MRGLGPACLASPRLCGVSCRLHLVGGSACYYILWEPKLEVSALLVVEGFAGTLLLIPSLNLAWTTRLTK